MARTKKRARRRLSIRGMLVLVLILLFIAAGTLFITGNSPETTISGLTRVEFTTNDVYASTGTAMLTITGNTLNYRGFKSSSDDWSLSLVSDGFRLACSQNIIAIYSDSAMQALSMQGTPLFPGQEYAGTVMGARCAKKTIAVLKKENSGEYTLYLYSATGDKLDTIRLPAYPMDFGFYGDEQLYVYTLSAAGTTPVATVTTYNPGVSTTGVIILENQLVDGVFFTPQYTYIAGTDTLRTFDSTGKSYANTLIYGYKVLDCKADETSVYFLLVPRTQSSEGTTAKLMTLNGKQSSIYFRLPPDWLGTWFYGDVILTVTKSAVVKYSMDGSVRSSFSLAGEFDFAKLLDNARMLLGSRTTAYIANIG